MAIWVTRLLILYTNSKGCCSKASLQEGVIVKIEYSRDVDALYIRLREARIVDSEDLAEGITVDLDEQGHIVGIEILDASEKIDAAELLAVSQEMTPVT